MNTLAITADVNKQFRLKYVRTCMYFLITVYYHGVSLQNTKQRFKLQKETFLVIKGKFSQIKGTLLIIIRNIFEYI